MNIYFKYKILPTNNGTEQLALLHKSMLVLISSLFLVFTHVIAEEPANQPIIKMQKRIKQLIKGLESDNISDRRKTTEALGRIGLAAVPALIEGLQDRNLYVRKESAKPLGKIGPAAKAAIPELIKALKDNFGDVSNNAAESFEKNRLGRYASVN